jgi:catechol 2,3-dioxygenase-like lactoylglutathione lyase family enzyme
MSKLLSSPPFICNVPLPFSAVCFKPITADLIRRQGEIHPCLSAAVYWRERRNAVNSLTVSSQCQTAAISTRRRYVSGRPGGANVATGDGRHLPTEFIKHRPGCQITVRHPVTGATAVLTGISAITLATHDMARAIAFARRSDSCRNSVAWRRASPAIGPESAASTSCRSRVNTSGAQWGRAILYVDDVDRFYGQAVSAGLRLEFAPRDGSWGERYLHVLHLDGHELKLRVTHLTRRSVTPMI